MRAARSARPRASRLGPPPIIPPSTEMGGAFSAHAAPRGMPKTLTEASHRAQPCTHVQTCAHAHAHAQPQRRTMRACSCCCACSVCLSCSKSRRIAKYLHLVPVVESPLPSRVIRRYAHAQKHTHRPTRASCTGRPPPPDVWALTQPSCRCTAPQRGGAAPGGLICAKQVQSPGNAIA